MKAVEECVDLGEEGGRGGGEGLRSDKNVERSVGRECFCKIEYPTVGGGKLTQANRKQGKDQRPFWPHTELGSFFVTVNALGPGM